MDVQNIDVDKLDAFTKAYIEAALWSSSVEQAGVDLGVASHTDTSFQDANFDANDIAPESLKAIVIECHDFQEQNQELLAAAAEDDAQHGHDFWLTRNRHGAGFWDRGYPEGLGEKLTEAARPAAGAICTSGTIKRCMSRMHMSTRSRNWTKN
jgi:hypothetical protein